MTWNINPVAINLGAIKIHWYGIIFATGLFLAYNLTEYMFKKEGKNSKDIESLFVYVVVGMIIGSRLAHVLFYDLDFYLAHPLEIFMVWHGGLASHGGFLGVIIALWLFAKKYNYSYMWLLSRGAIGAMLIATFIRIGNFFNSEIVGLPTKSLFGVIFQRVDNIPRHPVVLYESLAYFIIFLILLTLYKKLSPQKFTKIGFGLVLVLGFGARVFLEQFKTAQSEFAYELPLTMGQLLSIPFIIIGAIILIYGLKSNNTSTN